MEVSGSHPALRGIALQHPSQTVLYPCLSLSGKDRTCKIHHFHLLILINLGCESSDLSEVDDWHHNYANSSLSQIGTCFGCYAFLRYPRFFPCTKVQRGVQWSPSCSSGFIYHHKLPSPCTSLQRSSYFDTVQFGRPKLQISLLYLRCLPLSNANGSTSFVSTDVDEARVEAYPGIREFCIHLSNVKSSYPVFSDLLPSWDALLHDISDHETHRVQNWCLILLQRQMKLGEVLLLGAWKTMMLHPATSAFLEKEFSVIGSFLSEGGQAQSKKWSDCDQYVKTKDVCANFSLSLLFTFWSRAQILLFLGRPMSLLGCGVWVRGCLQEHGELKSHQPEWCLRRAASLEIYGGFHTTQQIQESPLLSSLLLQSWHLKEQMFVCFQHRIQQRPPRRWQDTFKPGVYP